MSKKAKKTKKTEKQVENQSKVRFQKECQKLAREYGIETGIRRELLDLCLEIPEEGFKVVHQSYVMVIVSPGSYYHLDDDHNIGCYNIENGVLVFVNNDGRAFLTRDRMVLGALKQAGYIREETMRVPLSDGAVIVDNDGLWSRWYTIVKTASI